MNTVLTSVYLTIYWEGDEKQGITVAGAMGAPRRGLLLLLRN